MSDSHREKLKPTFMDITALKNKVREKDRDMATLEFKLRWKFKELEGSCIKTLFRN